MTLILEWNQKKKDIPKKQSLKEEKIYPVLVISSQNLVWFSVSSPINDRRSSKKIQLSLLHQQKTIGIFSPFLCLYFYLKNKHYRDLHKIMFIVSTKMMTPLFIKYLIHRKGLLFLKDESYVFVVVSCVET